MIEILLGLCVLFLFVCFIWTTFFIYKFDISISEPPKIILIIGKTLLVIFAITIVLSLAYVIGGICLSGLRSD